VVLDSLTLQLSIYTTSKSWWLPTSWLNDVRSQKTWIPKNIAVITRNVDSKHFCLLQLLMAALLLVARAAIVKRYPHPDKDECNKYYLRIDKAFYSLTCPNKLQFDQYIEQCTKTADCTRNIKWHDGRECGLDEPSYYCVPPSSYMYCTHDRLKITGNVQCPKGSKCPTDNMTGCLD